MSKTPITYGVDYYPEQWSESRWSRDISLMQKVGIRVVRLAEFAWGLFEPVEGQFEWGWLDRALNQLEAAGIQVVLCTPTPTPPMWLTQHYPDALRVNEEGVRMAPGTRRHICANHPDYRRLAMRISQKIAARYGQHKAVIAWQTDNEYGCHNTIRCTCSSCELAFQRWLQERYGSLEALNEAWGTVFWSQRYTAWQQITPPRAAPAGHNPSLMLDFYRFSSDTWLEFNRTQVQILRQETKNQKITHNLMIYFFHFDHYKLAQDLDFVSWDNYHHHGAQPITIAANHDLMWGAKEQNFWVIEQQVGQVNWSVYNPQFPPQMLTLKVMQAIAHGADGILYFRWRQARHAAEMYHSGLLDHAARPTRAFGEALVLGEQWERLASLLEGTTPNHDAAILFDFPSHWSLEFQPHTASLDLYHPNEESLLFVGEPPQPLVPMNRPGLYLFSTYEALWRNNLQAAIIAPTGQFARYKVLFAPQLHVVNEEMAARLQTWVEEGGTLVLGPRAGFKNDANALHDIPQPGPLTHLIGGTVREFDTRAPGETLWVDFGDARLEAGIWCEIWEPLPETHVLATYEPPSRQAHLHPFYAGQPAILYKRHGEGQVITLGTMGGWQLINHLLSQCGLMPAFQSASNVEVLQRGELLFLLNHTAKEQVVLLNGEWLDALEPSNHIWRVNHGGRLGALLDPYGYLVLIPNT